MGAGALSDWGRQTRGGLVWAIATFAASRLSTLIVVAVVARLLPPSEFGIFAATLVYLAVLELASDLGMKATVVYEQETGLSRRLDTAFTVNLLFAVVLTALGVVFAPAVADLLRIDGADGIFRLAALTLVFTALGNIHDSILLRDLEFRRRASPILTRAVVRGAVSILLAVVGLGAESLVAGMLAGAVAFTVIQWRLTPFRPRLAIEREVVRGMAGYGSTQALLGVVALVVSRIDSAVVVRVLGERALGLYSVAFRVPELLLETLAWQVSLVAFPALSRQRAIDEEGLNGATLKLVRYQALYSLPVAVGVAVLATPLIVTVFSSTWAPAAAVVVPVSLMLGLYTIAIPMGETFRAVGKQRWLVVLAVLQLPLVITAVVLTADQGIEAVGWARFAAVTLHSLLTFAVVMTIRRIPVADIGRALWPGAISAVGVALGAGAVRVAWDDASLLPLLAGMLAGSVGAVVALRTCAPAAWRQVLHQVTDTIASRRSASAA